MNRPETISKVLTRNDSGETGGHQAGIHIPKRPDILSFFPVLNNDIKNPRVLLKFRDDAGDVWEFQFIYYNNKYYGGTRNEYRLTCMTPFLRSKNLTEGDTLTLHRQDNSFTVSYERASSLQVEGTAKLVLGNTWKVISIKNRSY